METYSELESRPQVANNQSDSQWMIEHFQQHKDLVSLISRKLKRRLPAHIRQDDLESAGNEGLWKALQSFSTDHGVPFEKYAVLRIRGAMLDELRRMDELSRTQRMQLKQAQAAYGVQQQSAYTVPLDSDERYEWIVDDNAVSPEDSAVRSSEITTLNRALVKLSDQEKLVLAMVFNEGLTLAETAEVMSLSRSRISAIYNGALKSLKGSMIRAYGR